MPCFPLVTHAVQGLRELYQSQLEEIIGEGAMTFPLDSTPSLKYIAKPEEVRQGQKVTNELVQIQWKTHSPLYHLPLASALGSLDSINNILSIC